jgi:hypothetical protein
LDSEGPVAKHRTKTVTHLPATPPAAPRLAAQLFVAFGELVAVALCVVGVVTVAGWLMSSTAFRKPVATPARPQPDLICFMDRRTGEWCQPVDRPRRWSIRG